MMVFRTSDPRGIIVTCSESQWENHIVASKSIMLGNEDAVKNTVETPDVIYGSEKHEDRDVYFKKESGATYSGKLYTKVIVAMRGNEGDVITAFPKEHISGNINPEELKYVKPKL